MPQTLGHIMQVKSRTGNRWLNTTTRNEQIGESPYIFAAESTLTFNHLICYATHKHSLSSHATTPDSEHAIQQAQNQPYSTIYKVKVNDILQNGMVVPWW